MQRKIILGSVFLYMCSFPAFSQILKVSKGRLATDTSSYFTGIIDGAFALNNRSSTVDEQNLYLGITNNVDLVYLSEKSASILISGLNYYKIGDGPLIYNGTAHFREILRRKATFTPEVYGQVQFDESRQMELRWLAGGGFRWNILQKSNSLFMGVGAFREYERWDGESAVIRKRLLKLNSYMSADVALSPTTSVNAIAYFQSGRDAAIDAFRHRFSGNLEIKNAITDRLKIKMTSNFLLDDKPIIALNRFIYEVFFGLEYGFN
ncbi:MAG: hypothetical protein Tsb0034_30520 [Ekhidna sp.]